jgi:predicted anti-sigma-YlaC factor YlaD
MSTKKSKKAGHCRNMGRTFSQYLDKELAKEMCRKLEHHLKDCPDCRAYFDTLNRTVTLYRSLGHSRVPRDAEQRLFKTISLSAAKKRGSR